MPMLGIPNTLLSLAGHVLSLPSRLGLPGPEPADTARLPQKDAHTATLDGHDVELLDLSKTSAQLMKEKAHALKRPVIMVHGLGMGAECWDPIKNYLCSNSHNTYGGTYSVDGEAAFKRSLAKHPDARVFTINLSDNRKPPEEVAAELTRMIDLVTKMTGCKNVDLVTHSMGGLQGREHLARGNGRINKFVMLSPPNHGSEVADLGLAAWDTHVYQHYPSDKKPVLHALQSEQRTMLSWGNPWLQALDQAWQRDSHRVKTTIITGTGVPTLSTRGAEPGDLLVTARSAWLPNAHVIVAQPQTDMPEYREAQSVRFNHLNILTDPVVARKVDQVLYQKA